MNNKILRRVTAIIVVAFSLLASIYFQIDYPQNRSEHISQKTVPVDTSVAASQSQNTVASYTEAEKMGSTVIEPNPNDIFDSFVVNNEKELSKIIPAHLANLVWQSFEKFKCDSPQLVIYSKEGKTGKLIVSNCHKVIEPANNEHEAFFDIEYPVMVSVSPNAVNELDNLSEFGFMYESGMLKAVTDINNNGHLELWLEGDICECDGDEYENEPCDCTGTRVVEAFYGQLKKFKP